MQKYLKAIFAAALAGLGAAQSAYVAGGNHIGWDAGIVIAIATLSAGAVVWGVPNASPEPPAPPA